MSSRRGTSVVEALVGTALAGLAVAGLCVTGGLVVHALRRVRDTSTALTFATQRLEAFRGGPRVDGRDAPAAVDGTVFDRIARVEEGRGAPDRLSVELRWGARSLRLETSVFP